MFSIWFTRRATAALPIDSMGCLTVVSGGSVQFRNTESSYEDIPDERRQDPIWHRTGGADPGRDGSRVPLPWSGREPPFGFSPPGAAAGPWLPAPGGVLSLARGGVACVANLSAVPVGLPPHTAVLLASGPLAGGLLPPDTSAWLRLQ